MYFFLHTILYLNKLKELLTLFEEGYMKREETVSGFYADIYVYAGRVYEHSRNVGPFAGDTVRPCDVTSHR